MTWDQRGAKRYYYRREQRDGRSVRTYCGTGPVAELAATADALQRVQRESRARQWRHEQARRAAGEALLVALDDHADVLVRAALLAAGFRQHDRGDWRRTRDKLVPDRDD